MSEIVELNEGRIATREKSNKHWDIVNNAGELLRTLPYTYTARDLAVFFYGYDAGRAEGVPAGFKAGYNTGRRAVRRDVLKAMGVYDSMQDLQAMSRILADVAKMEETK